MVNAVSKGWASSSQRTQVHCTAPPPGGSCVTWISGRKLTLESAVDRLAGAPGGTGSHASGKLPSVYRYWRVWLGPVRTTASEIAVSEGPITNDSEERWPWVAGT